uniref:MFS transporter n=1 Tax=Citrifermentans bremense TaxID=60035 RepID=UPI00117B3CF2
MAARGAGREGRKRLRQLGYPTWRPGIDYSYVPYLPPPGRDGAFFWSVFYDPAVPGRFVETFSNETWVEHLRQHDRITKADRQVEDAVRAFQIDGEPPKVEHLIHADLDDGANYKTTGG